MNINSVSNTSFEGKIVYGKKMTKQMLEYSNKILDKIVDGNTARMRIKKAPFDLEIHKSGTKKTIHPKIFFQSYYYRLGDNHKYYTYSSSVKLNSNISKGAKELNNFLDKFEEKKDAHKDAYNTLWEKFLAFFKNF